MTDKHKLFVSNCDAKNTRTIKFTNVTEINKNKLAKLNFENMAYTYRKEYVRYITEVKKEATQINRLEKTIKKLEKNLKINE